MHRNNVCFLKLPISNLWDMCLPIPCSSLTSLCVPTSLLLLIATKKIRCLCCAWEALLCWCSLPRQVQLIAQKQCNTGWEPTLHNLSGKVLQACFCPDTHVARDNFESLEPNSLRMYLSILCQSYKLGFFCIQRPILLETGNACFPPRGQTCWRLELAYIQLTALLRCIQSNLYC